MSKEKDFDIEKASQPNEVRFPEARVNNFFRRPDGSFISNEDLQELCALLGIDEENNQDPLRNFIPIENISENDIHPAYEYGSNPDAELQEAEEEWLITPDIREAEELRTKVEDVIAGPNIEPRNNKRITKADINKWIFTRHTPGDRQPSEKKKTKIRRSQRKSQFL